MKVRESWIDARRALSGCGVEDAGLEAELVVRHVMGAERHVFFASLQDGLTASQQSRVSVMIRRRVEGEPLAYLVGHREFYGLDLVVDPAVLIPRQETESLVDLVLEFARARAQDETRPGPLSVADVGTGSGAIAVAIARHLPGATIYATDASADALRVAALNARSHGVSQSVRLLHGDLLEPLSAPVDVIVSNPPYISSGDMAGLQREIAWEPPMALDGGDDGLGVIRRLLGQAPAHLRPSGLMLVEIAPEQLSSVQGIARSFFSSAVIAFGRDLAGDARLVSVQLDSAPARRPGALQTGSKSTND